MPDALATTPASANFQKLKDKLRELFELDKADLDFGIYRVLRQRHREITEFLDRQLETTVREALRSHQSIQTDQIAADLAKTEAAARDAGFNPDQSQKVLELRERLKTSGDVEAVADEVYSHLLTFFSRYYQEGDFIGLHRSTVHGREKYMIPYNGEEVKLVWANMDQYYIKSSELLRDYSFLIKKSDWIAAQAELPLGDLPEQVCVHFKLVEGDTEKDNRKASGKTTRAFALAEPACTEKDGALYIHFAYREHTAERALQDKLNADTTKTLADALPGVWRTLLLAADPTHQPKDKKDVRSVLQKHLRAYTARHQFDYFIHKDLGGFLRRELDFYLKNEVVHLDDIENAGSSKAEEYLSKLRAIRRCATPVIRMLAQLEDFQKKLWLKKKFVVETRYCLTLDRVPETLYPNICKNDAQWQEWEELVAISELKPKRTPEFLKAHPYLMIDTRHFPREFTLKLLAFIENLDATLDGACFHSENFQALQLMTETFKDRIRSVYLDPPFNLGANGDFLYKTDYKDSSWACLLQDRLRLTKPLVTALGFVFVRCDINGNFIARPILNNVFGSENFHAELLVQRIRKNVTTQGKLTIPLANDSLFLFQRSAESELVNPFLKLKETRQSYWRRMDDSAGFRNPPERLIFGKKLLPYKTDAHFKFSQKNVDEMSLSGRVRLRCKACGYEHLSGQWSGCANCGIDDPVAQYLVEETDVKILDTNWLGIAGYSHTTGFSTENSEVLLCRAIEATSHIREWVLDFFGGSGTTAAASFKTSRRFISVEAGDHHEGILIPRLKKVAMATKKTLDGKEGDDRTGIFKILRLESYEDTLNNLVLRRTPEQEAALMAQPTREQGEYMLGYFLDVESAGSASVLDVAQFRDPFAYKLKIATSSAGETKETPVDLVETFNWLLGLKVRHIDAPQGFVTVTGERRDGKKVLVVWRKLGTDAVADNAALQRLFDKLQVNPAETSDTDYAAIYVNGAHTLADPHGKIHLTEEEFHRRMFATEQFSGLES